MSQNASFAEKDDKRRTETRAILKHLLMLLVHTKFVIPEQEIVRQKIDSKMGSD